MKTHHAFYLVLGGVLLGFGFGGAPTPGWAFLDIAVGAILVSGTLALLSLDGRRGDR